MINITGGLFLLQVFLFYSSQNIKLVGEYSALKEDIEDSKKTYK
jgi:hypothetical protein